MKRFVYSTEERQDILGSLAGPVVFGTNQLPDSRVIEGLESWAAVYLNRIDQPQRAKAKSIALKIYQVESVMAMLKNDEDGPHLRRLDALLRHLHTERYFVESPRERRARQQFIVDAFSVYAHADQQCPMVEFVLLSDSEAPSARFFRSAIYPVCDVAGEKIELRQAINQFKNFKNEMREAEIDLIMGEIEYAANES